MTAFYAALAGAGVGGGFALIATFAAHLLESRREWRAQLRRTYLEMRAAALWATYPVFSEEGHQHRLVSLNEAERWNKACLALPEKLLDLRAIVRGNRGWKAALCQQLDIMQTMFDAAMKRYSARQGALGVREGKVLMNQLRHVEQLVFGRGSPPSLDVEEFDRRVDFWIANGLDVPYIPETSPP